MRHLESVKLCLTPMPWAACLERRRFVYIALASSKSLKLCGDVSSARAFEHRVLLYSWAIRMGVRGRFVFGAGCELEPCLWKALRELFVFFSWATGIVVAARVFRRVLLHLV